MKYTVLCKICKSKTTEIFKVKILNKYDIKYYHCKVCGFLQTEEPYWLEEVYKESINISDTGIMFRNQYLSKVTSIIIYFLFNKNQKYLDYGGGYGIFTRLMRDIGFDFYWDDKYSENLVARGFEYNGKDRMELLTSFETFEHFNNPINEIEKMLKISKNILFTTELLPVSVPGVNDWWYYGLEHGQHISFYSLDTLKYIAGKYGLQLHSNNRNIHLLTDKKINSFIFKMLIKLNRIGLSNILKIIIKSKTNCDMNLIINRINNQ